MCVDDYYCDVHGGLLLLCMQRFPVLLCADPAAMCTGWDLGIVSGSEGLMNAKVLLDI